MDFRTLDPRCTTITVLACFVYHKKVTLTGLQALRKCNGYFGASGYLCLLNTALEYSSPHQWKKSQAKIRTVVVFCEM